MVLAQNLCNANGLFLPRCVPRYQDFDAVRAALRRALTGVTLVELAVNSVDEESASDVLDL